MKSPEELLGEFAGDPARLAQYAGQLQDQLAPARAYLAELKQQLFGPKADKLTPEQEEPLQPLRAQPRFLPQSTFGKAVNCFLKEYTPRVGYLPDGRFEIDNNLVENDVPPSAVGRRRWLFIGHPDAGGRRAVIDTLIQSGRRDGINPQADLTDVLSRLPALKNHPVRQLLPSRWKPASARPAEADAATAGPGLPQPA